MHKVKAEQVTLGCGSTEILKVAASAFTGPGKKLVMASPTFEAIEFYAKAAKADVVKVPLASTLRAPTRADGAGRGQRRRPDLRLQSQQSHRQPHAAPQPGEFHSRACRRTHTC